MYDISKVSLFDPFFCAVLSGKRPEISWICPAEKSPDVGELSMDEKLAFLILVLFCRYNWHRGGVKRLILIGELSPLGTLPLTIG